MRLQSKKHIVDTNKANLRRKSLPVDMNNKELIEQVESTLLNGFAEYDGKVQGLAAIQLWKPYRAILVRFKKGEPPIICYNPEINFKFGSKSSIEGCESEPGHKYVVRRPLITKVTFCTKDNEKKTMLLTYKKARIFCHEVDHLDGILLCDKGVAVPT
jgi:peptide deformylase